MTRSCQTMVLVMAVVCPISNLRQVQSDEEPARRHADVHGDPLPEGTLARLGTTRFHHGGDVFFVGYAEQGKHLVSVGGDGKARVWDRADGKELHTWDIPRVPWSSGIVQTGYDCSYDQNLTMPGLLLSPDGRILATLHDKEAKLLELASGRTRKLAVGINGYGQAAISPDGKLLAIYSGRGSLQLWDLATAQVIRSVSFEDHIKALTFMPDGQIFLTAVAAESKGSVIEFWETGTGKKLRDLSTPHKVKSLQFTPDGKGLVLVAESGICENAYILVDPKTGQKLRNLEIDCSSCYAPAITFSPDGRNLAARGSFAVSSWDLAANKKSWDFHRPVRGRENVTCRATENLAYAPDGKTLAVGWWDGRVLQLDTASGKEQAPLLQPITTLVVSADARSVLTLEQFGPARKWDLATGKELGPIELPDHLEIAAFSADGRWLALARDTEENAIELWDVPRGRKQHTWPVEGFRSSGFSLAGDLAFTADGKRLALREANGNIQVWDTDSGRELNRFASREENQMATVFINGIRPGIAFSPDGRALALVAQDDQRSRIELWDPANGQRLRQYEPASADILAIGFSPDGRYLAAANTDYTITLWEIATSKPCRRFLVEQQPLAMNRARPRDPPRHIDPLRMLTCLAFSADGRLLAAAGTDRTVHFWETHSGLKVRDCEIHRGCIQCLAFTADNRRLVTGSRDGTGLVLEVPPGISLSKEELSDPQLQAHWDSLAGAADPAHRAMEALARAPESTVVWIGRQVQPVRAGRYARLIANLESDQFDVRQQATEELERAGDRAEADLREALDSNPSLETRQRLEQLLARLDGWSSQELRNSRAVIVLEHIGTPPAQKILESLAQGAPKARLTQAAKAAVERLAKR